MNANVLAGVVAVVAEQTGYPLAGLGAETSLAEVGLDAAGDSLTRLQFYLELEARFAGLRVEERQAAGWTTVGAIAHAIAARDGREQ